MNSAYPLVGPFVLLVLAVGWLTLRRMGYVIIRRRNERHHRLGVHEFAYPHCLLLVGTDEDSNDDDVLLAEMSGDAPDDERRAVAPAHSRSFSHRPRSRAASALAGGGRDLRAYRIYRRESMTTILINGTMPLDEKEFTHG